MSGEEENPGVRKPPRRLGWFFVMGSPVFAAVVTAWYWEDGFASIVLNSWYMLVTFTFGVVILRSTRRSEPHVHHRSMAREGGAEQ